MIFRKGGDNLAFQVSTATLTARPALAGAWLDVRLIGHTTTSGTHATPTMGWIQFHTPNGLFWPRFEFRQTPQLRCFRDDCDEDMLYGGYVSYAQLEAFEKERNEKDFSVQMEASLSVFNKQENHEHWQVNNESLQKTAQEWLQVLASSGYKNYLFHELAFPAGSNTKPNSVYSHLRQGRELFDKGLYRECILHLRMGEERLRKKRKDTTELTDTFDILKSNKKAMTLQQRLLALRNIAHHATHPAAHDSPEPSSSFTRERAKALLIITSALFELFPEPDVEITGDSINSDNPP